MAITLNQDNPEQADPPQSKNISLRNNTSLKVIADNAVIKHQTDQISLSPESDICFL
jgi:hypothetical protein